MTRPHTPRRKAAKHHWTAAEIATLRARYPDTLTRALADDLGISLNAVHNMAFKLGLYKTRAYKSAQARSAGNGTSTRFQPGHTTWNKGQKFVAGGRSAETRFKKGQATHNHKPVGSTRINVDGYIEIKIAEPRTWAALHRIVWQQHHGALPKDMPVCFKDGDRQNCDINNLETVPRTALMRRNTCHNHGPEIAQLIQLRGVITRQINKRQKEKAA